MGFALSCALTLGVGCAQAKIENHAVAADGAAKTRSDALPQTGSAKAPLGVNIGTPQFVDAMKTANAFSGLEGKPVTLDASGWPTGDAEVGVFDTRVNMPWNGPDPLAVPADMSGTYHLSFSGQADVTPHKDSPFTLANKKYEAATDTTTADLVLPKGENFLIVQFRNTKGGVRNVKLIRPGYPVITKQVFTTPFLDAIQPFQAIRLMDFLATNNFSRPDNGGAYPAVTEWKDRRLPTDATQSEVGNGSKHGVAWEYALQLANQSGKDVWINVPVAATDDYVTQLANLLKNGDTVGGVKYSGLNPKLHLYLEYSNEVWNSGFVQAWWNNTAAAAQKLGSNELYARRAKEVGDIFAKAFGPAARNTTVRPVLMWQEADRGGIAGMLDFIDKSYGAPDKFFYAIGAAPYLTAKDTTSTDAILTGFEADTLEHRALLEHYAYLAHFYHLKLLAYEGGTGLNGADNLDKKLAANRDPRIKPLLKNFLLNDWYGIGGDLFMYYGLAGTPSQWGQWGLIEGDLSKLDTPKYQAALEVSKSPRPVDKAGTALPTEIGKSVSVDEGGFEGTYWKPGTQAQNMWNQPGTRQDYFLHADAAGTYSITIESLQEMPGQTEIYVDDQLIGTSALPATVTTSLAPGPHALYLLHKGATAMGGGKQIIITRTK